VRTDTPAVHLRWGALSDCGPRRRLNEDSYLAGAPVFLVADGVGGHASGDVASRRAVAAFRPLLGGDSVDLGSMERAFDDAVRAVAQIRVRGRAPGTTLSGVALTIHDDDAYWLVLNIGDSRTYRHAEGRLEQVSVDHSAVQELVDSGELTAVDAEQHPRRHVITRAIGAGSRGYPDFWLLPAFAGDRMLVCSDGLSRELAREEIERALCEEFAPQTAAERLVREALDRGARDNVTVVVIDAIAADNPHADRGRADAHRHVAIVDSAVDEDTAPRLRQPRGIR